MTLRDCVVVAIEGTHASGKSTLVHALTAHYRASGVLVNAAAEPARTSPFIEEIVVHGRGQFDLPTEVDLFGAQLSTQLRASRHHQLLICDKSIVNVLAYARLVLPAPPGSREATVLEAMTSFCRAWVSVYDTVLLCTDRYDPSHDPLRKKVDALDLRGRAATAVQQLCAELGVRVAELPPGLDLAGRVDWAAEHIDRFLTLQGAP